MEKTIRRITISDRYDEGYWCAEDEMDLALNECEVHYIKKRIDDGHGVVYTFRCGEARWFGIFKELYEAKIPCKIE